jgi:hypothetical protein
LRQSRAEFAEASRVEGHAGSDLVAAETEETRQPPTRGRPADRTRRCCGPSRRRCRFRSRGPAPACSRPRRASTRRCR